MPDRSNDVQESKIVLDDYCKQVASFGTFEEAFKYFRGRTGVSPEVSNEFLHRFAVPDTEGYPTKTMQEAFKAFYGYSVSKLSKEGDCYAKS